MRRKLSLTLVVLILTFPISVHPFDFNVTTAPDADCSDFQCDLQAALTAAQNNNSNDILHIAAGNYDASGGTFIYSADNTPGSEENFTLTLIGADPATTILDGGGVDQVLSIGISGLTDDSNAAVTIMNLGFENGKVDPGNGGGVSVFTVGANTLIENCIFRNNFAGNNGGGVNVFSNGSGDMIFRKNRFIDHNMANNNGGGASGFAVQDGQIIFEGNHFEGNESGNTGGGAISFLLGPGSSTTFTNNTFFQNMTSNSGGGVDVITDQDVTMTFTNNTFTGNSGDNGGGLSIFSETDGAVNNLFNNIIRGNTASTGPDVYIFNSDVDANNIGGVINFFNNISSGFFDDCNMGACTSTVNQGNNQDVDPLFVASTPSDFHLQENSPAIDAGDPAAPALPAEDFEGDNRIIGAAPDIGADEFKGCGDGEVDAGGGEGCDDGNLTDGDGCNSTCQIETGFVCTGEPSECTAVESGCRLTKNGNTSKPYGHFVLAFSLMLLVLGRVAGSIRR